MNITPVINQIIMLFLLLGAGLMLRKLGIFKDGVIKGVNELVLTLTWPALMISATQKDFAPDMLVTFAWIFFGSIAIMTVALVATFIVFRRTNRDAAQVMAMLATMPNCGFFGIPIIQALYGDVGLLYLSGYIVGFNIVLWTVAVAMFTGLNAKALKNLLNPGIVCAFVGISFFLLRVHLPDPLLSAVNQLSAMNTPLSMLILGARMDALRLSHVKDGRMWTSIVIKLLIMPAVALLAFRLMGVTGMTLMILVGCSAMPTAAAGQMLVERYGGDVLLSAKGTSICTLCSALTLPLMLYFTSLVA